ncbi:MAG TPA: hypothetical protein VMN99_15700 [Anaerolineales bacterium]|nr:hypothetical protein [Anaerolineales bacterium]
MLNICEPPALLILREDYVKSLKNFANTEAVQFFDEVLRLADLGKVGRLRLGQWYRKMGDAYLGLGKIVEAKEYVLKAMETLGLPLPASDVALMAGILKQVARQAGHRVRPRRYRGKEIDAQEEAIRLEIVILTEKLVVVQFLNGDPSPLPMLYAVIAGLNVAETLEDTPELWAMYATMNVSAMHRSAWLFLRKAGWGIFPNTLCEARCGWQCG